MVDGLVDARVARRVAPPFEDIPFDDEGSGGLALLPQADNEDR